MLHVPIFKRLMAMRDLEGPKEMMNHAIWHCFLAYPNLSVCVITWVCPTVGHLYKEPQKHSSRAQNGVGKVRGGVVSLKDACVSILSESVPVCSHRALLNQVSEDRLGSLCGTHLRASYGSDAPPLPTLTTRH